MSSSRQLATYCFASALGTALLGLVFVETAYPTVRRSIGNVVRGERIPGQIASSPVAKASEERYRQILEETSGAIRPELATEFLKGYYSLNIWNNLYYLGTQVMKYPTDLWVMQQIIHDVKPEYIVETGTAYGGSSLYWSHILDGLGLENTRIITVDIADYTLGVSKQPLWKKYVEFIKSSSTDPKTADYIRQKVSGKKVLVLLDSLHTADHVLQEIHLYSPLVTPGSYMVVEDTHIDGIAAEPEVGPGPMTAVNKFLKEEGGDKKFEQDLLRETLILTQNRGGWLKRRAD
jgi:cephalosporin hydroxylase